MLRRGVRVGFTGQSGCRMRLPLMRRQDRRLRNRQSRVKVNKSVHKSVIMDGSGSTEPVPSGGGHGGQGGWTHHEQSV
jgi:hypothetical protein